MKPIHFLACLFAVSVGLVDLVALTGFKWSYDAPLMLFVGLALGQLALLAFWCVLGRGMWAVRLIATLTAAACLSQPLGKITAGNWSQWFTLLCLFTACTAGTTWLAILLGVRPRIADATPVATAPKFTRQSLNKRFPQFSLGSLLSIVTVISLGLGLSRYLAFPREQSFAVAGYGFWLVLIAFATLVAAVSRQPFFARLLGLATLCLVAGWCMAHTETQPDAWFFTNVALIEAMVICMGIAVLQSGLQQPFPAVESTT